MYKNIDIKIKGIFHRFLLKLNGLLKSLKFRIFVLVLLLGIFIPIIIGINMYDKVESEMVGNKMNRLLSQTNILKDNIVKANYMDSGESDSIDAELTQLSAMYDGRIIIIDNSFHIIKDTYIIDEGKIVVSSDVIKAYKGKEISKYDENSSTIEIVHPITNDSKSVIGVMYVTFSTADISDSMNDIEDRISIISNVIVIFVIIFAVFISWIFVRPLNKAKEQFTKMRYGYLDTKLDLSTYTEMKEFSDGFNAMVDRMQKIDDSRQEFVSNVSHELKTPMTSIKVLADSLKDQEDVPNELYKDFFEDIANEIDRENEIISSLLALVRTEKNNISLNIKKANINDVIEGILKRVRPIAGEKNVELVLESFKPIEAEIDELKLTSAITNLVENAVKYNVVDGWVRVSLNADHQYFYIKVADSGIGIPDDSQDMVFERFYRVDKDRARKTGGTGLGLAITKNIILLHNGEIKVYSKEGEGTTFTVRIPLTYVKQD